MNIEEAIKFFKNLITETDTTSEIKVYAKFIAMLSRLQNRDLSDEQLKKIEDKIGALDFEISREHRKKYYKRELVKFSKAIKKQLSLISEGYYMTILMSLGMCLGMSLGMTFGIVFNSSSEVSNGLIYGMSVGMPLGMAIGLGIGLVMDAKAKKENKVL